MAASIFEMGDYKAAKNRYRQARDIFQTIGLSHLSIRVEHFIADVDAQQIIRSDPLQSTIIRQKAIHLGRLGSVYLKQGNYTLAYDHFNEALAIARKIGDKEGEVSSLINMGATLWKEGLSQQALDYYRQALTTSRLATDPVMEGICLGVLGNAYADLGQYDQSIDYLKQARAVFQSIGAIDSILVCQFNIVKVHVRKLWRWIWQRN